LFVCELVAPTIAMCGPRYFGLSAHGLVENHCVASVDGDRNSNVTILGLGDPPDLRVEWRPPNTSGPLLASISYDLSARGALSRPTSIQTHGRLRVDDPSNYSSSQLIIQASNGAGWRTPLKFVINGADRSPTDTLALDQTLYAGWKGISPLFDAVEAGKLVKVAAIDNSSKIFVESDIDVSALKQRDQMLGKGLAHLKAVARNCPTALLIPPLPSVTTR
jgi:hypothetical protein